ncbi:hypothetical protein LCGC14_2168950 [marine sediment metagenome]|uniref:Phage protein n=1 Tax=marine sediment metagenome TaxID=412755 RepID=A0A0F8Y1N9_9ZZZZ
MKIKTIDVNALEWFDKVNGNSYFSAEVVLNYMLSDEVILKLPFQYGYGDHYNDVAMDEIVKKLDINYDGRRLWKFCEENNIILRTSKKENCLKKELI